MANLGDPFGPLEWVWDLIVFFTGFQEYPDGEADDWRDLGSRWLDMSTELSDRFNDMNTQAVIANMYWGGSAGTKFAEQWQKFVTDKNAGPNTYASLAQDYYIASLSGAMQLEFTQLMLILIVAFTAIELAIAALLSEFGGEAAVPGII